MAEQALPSAEDGVLRPDVSRVVARLEAIIGQQTSKIVQYETVIEQLQQTITDQAAEIARLKLPPERAPQNGTPS
ncbi:hypothetical protein SAMN05443637_13528 [Pseudonocardia thermophila]|jgi:hypothetical protein|uniref:Uncharacterized protein n=1 Tax=Pseudonocardia thermophila TaxID=1848 RepID=A0A1M7BEH7_PSETH|nr:hypothetical protein [Pseudonocardia thermophila]SHL53334.1 hypothetical protein SAMN05443637_13528 [Pseudonocardia thermophila]